MKAAGRRPASPAPWWRGDHPLLRPVGQLDYPRARGLLQALERIR